MSYYNHKNNNKTKQNEKKKWEYPLQYCHTQANDSIVSLIIPRDSWSCSSVITKGGVKRIMWSWVGFAKRPLSFSFKHTFQASKSKRKKEDKSLKNYLVYDLYWSHTQAYENWCNLREILFWQFPSQWQPQKCPLCTGELKIYGIYSVLHQGWSVILCINCSYSLKNKTTLRNYRARTRLGTD